MKPSQIQPQGQATELANNPLIHMMTADILCQVSHLPETPNHIPLTQEPLQFPTPCLGPHPFQFNTTNTSFLAHQQLSWMDLDFYNHRKEEMPYNKTGVLPGKKQVNLVITNLSPTSSNSPFHIHYLLALLCFFCQDQLCHLLSSQFFAESFLIGFLKSPFDHRRQSSQIYLC